MIEILEAERAAAAAQAWAALGRYKFWMFGYHAARVVTLDRLIHRAGGRRQPNPFVELVRLARSVTGGT